MHDVSDYELQRDVLPPARNRRPLVWWIIAAVVVVAAGAALWFYFRGGGAQEPAAAPVAAQAAAPAPAAGRPICVATDAANLPPLDETDAAVGKLVRALSSHPRVLAWLATDNLIRNFTVVVENMAYDQAPARHLRALRPSGPFRVARVNGQLRLDPRGYARYDPVAAAVGSVDAQAAARLCAALKPRLEEAYRELGRPEPFDAALERAMVALLRAPVVDGAVPLVPIPKGATFAFASPALEALTPAQKHLVRMGPRNTQIIQGRLREIAFAIGIPPERLPQ